MAVDPVCRMEVDPKTAAAEVEYQGQAYYFCAPGCKVAFDRAPERYLERSTSRQENGDQDGHHDPAEGKGFLLADTWLAAL